MRARSTLYTKEQVILLFAQFSCREPVPKKGQKVIICLPAKQAAEDDLIEVEWSANKSDAGVRLYSITMSSRAGRQIDQTIQESHVLAYTAALYRQHVANKLSVAARSIH